MTTQTMHPETRRLRVLDPVAPPPASTRTPPTVDSLDDKRVSIMANGWASWVTLRERLAGDLAGLHHGTTVTAWDVPLGSRADGDVLDRVAADSDLVVLGLANCGSCAVATAGNAGYLADRGVPVVAAVTERFTGLVNSLMPSLPLVVLPAALEQMGPDELRQIANGLLDEIAARFAGTAA